MTVYKVYPLRVIAVSLTLVTLLIFVILLTPPQKCIQVSVSVQQWPLSYQVKTGRVVQALEDAGVTSKSISSSLLSKMVNINNNAWFRTRLVSSPQQNMQKLSDLEEADDYVESDNNYDPGDEDDEYYNEFPDNKNFEDGDFDYNETDKYGLKYLQPDFSIVQQMFNDFKKSLNSTLSHIFLQSSPPKSLKYVRILNKRKKAKRKNIYLINVEGVPIVEDGIFWSEELEKRTPKGSEIVDAQFALQKLRSLRVFSVDPPTWNRCGRPKNQFVTFEDGSKACARYRSPHQYLVQGEVMSFYLARLLGIHNVPVVSLAAVQPGFVGMWSNENVKKNLIKSNWETNTTVALIQWIENLERDKMPSMLLSSLVNKTCLSANSASLLTLPVDKLEELLQWSDLIIFDYITGNYDRVASMQDAADKEGKPSILHETIHNLVRSKSNGALWLIDNESGLLDSYSLLYGPAGQDGRFRTFHKQMLNTICLFRRATVDRIKWLHHSHKAGAILMDVIEQFEPLFTPVEKMEQVSKRLQERIGEVNDHIERCLLKYSELS
ncbi:four-jointed box protein 1-like [Uloborus diversus]|uniref:four-jointed box protein 1-like n=1 Tax=Uloborus diversus TaxID=327109 RepID=UPI00240A28C8|nr:four-jointed box protein 1-like [Uloborus diversus]XP_054709914.1 four-jointed box protein 1-like [Uloborus diversus]